MSRTMIALFCWLAASAAVAAPFRVADIPAGTKWFVHVDCDALKSAPRIEAAWLKVAADPTLVEHMESLPFFRKIQWHDILAYSLGDDQMVAIFAVDLKEEVLQPYLKRETGYAQVKYGQHRIHHWVTDPQNKEAPLTKFNSANEKDANEAFYLCVHKSGRIVVANRLTDLIQQLRMWDGTIEPIAADDCPHHLHVKGVPTLVQYQQIQGESESQEPTCLYVAISGAEKTHVTTSWDLRTPMITNMMMQYAKPEAMIEAMKSLIPKEGEPDKVKTLTKNDEKEEDDDEHHGRLMFGADFKNLDLDDDRERIVAFIGRAMDVKREGAVVTLNWSSYTDATFDYTKTGDKHDIKFQLHLLTDDQEAERVAKQAESTEKRR